EVLRDQRLGLGQRRQATLVVVQLGVRVVRALHVGLEEPVEVDDLAGRAELGVLAGAGAPRHPDRDRLAGGVLHLRGHGALPDQVVHAQLVAGQAGRRRGAEAVPGRPDRLVRLLRALYLAGVDARLVRDVLGAVELP